MWLVNEIDSRYSLYSLSPVKGGTVIRYRTAPAVGQAWVYLCTLTAMWDPDNVLWSDWGNTILSWSYPDSISCLLSHLLASNPWSIKHILAGHLGLTTTVTMTKSITITADVFYQNKSYQVPRPTPDNDISLVLVGFAFTNAVPLSFNTKEDALGCCLIRDSNLSLCAWWLALSHLN